MKRRAFTLVELLIVIAVIAMLTLLAVTAYANVRANSKLTRVSSELAGIATSISQYAEDNNYTYPADVDRAVPPGLEKYLAGGVWPTSIWPHGVFDWDNWPYNNKQVLQVTYRLCGLSDPVSSCSDPVLFPTFGRDSSIFYCVSGPCIPHQDEPDIPGYCVDCRVKKVNY